KSPVTPNVRRERVAFDDGVGLAADALGLYFLFDTNESRLRSARVHMINRLLPALATLALITCYTSPAAAQTASAGTDPYLWLEDLEGPKALDWAKAENAKTLAVLQKDPRFAGFHAEALTIGEADDRIP